MGVKIAARWVRCCTATPASLWVARNGVGFAREFKLVRN